MNKPSISIIVPVYQVEPYIEDCLSSVIRQTYDGPMECIVVDDCSTDHSMALAEKLINQYQGPILFKILHHTHNRGLSAARNTGMDAAQGDYIYFLDSDDELTADCIETLVKPLQQEWYDVVLGFVKYLQVYPHGNTRQAYGPQELDITDDIILRQPVILESYRTRWAVVAWNRLCRTAFLKNNNIRFKEGLIYEDNLWSFQIACLASTLYIVSHATYIHKFREDSIMNHGNIKTHTENWTIILREMHSFVDDHHITTPKIFPFFDETFMGITNYYTYSRKEYTALYKSLRPYVKAPVRNIIRINGFRIRSYFKYIHYILPKSIAPLWQLFRLNFVSRLFERIHHVKQAFLMKFFPKSFISKRWQQIMGYPIDWEHPRDLNEKIQWLTVNSDTTAWTRLADKYQVREYVKEKGLEHLLVPLLGVWDDARKIDFGKLPRKFVLKCNHDSATAMFIDKYSPDFNRGYICKQFNGYLKRNFGDYGELHYRGIPPRIIAEQFLEMTDTEKELSTSHIDYKVWCFNGKPSYVWCFYDRSRRAVHLDVYDLDWNYHPEYTVTVGHYKKGLGVIPKPQSLHQMLEAASILSAGFPQVRVDFYDIDGKLYFGELTFTSAAGMMKCFTPDFLKILGDKTVI